LNLSSALLKQVVLQQDFETWNLIRKHYLTSEYHTLWNEIDKHCDKYHKMPSFDDLELGIRDSATRDKLIAVKNSQDVDSHAEILLDYLKNEYTQKEVLVSLEKYVDQSVAFEDAEETIAHLHQIIMDIEDKVDLKDPQESMQYIDLWESEEDLGRYVALGLNSEYDYDIQFSPRDLILVGGRRGAGKSLTCANIANNIVASGKTALYFTIEMDSRSILQRCCSIATGVPFSRLRLKNLSITEWEKVASWWANRFQKGEECLKEYKVHRDFSEFHRTLSNNHELLPTHLAVHYDASLTLAEIRSEVNKKVKGNNNLGIIIVDYLNQVKRSNLPSRNGGQYDWTEQIEVSKALKSMAQEFEVPVFSPYQTDASGEARFAKGILDAADAAYALETWTQEDSCMSFNCVKMRSASMKSFTSKVDWESLKIGPETALSPKEREENSQKTGEEIDDI
jgi:replicative DNA helicase